MTFLPRSFRALHDGWTVAAADTAAVPSELVHALFRGIPATVPGEVHLDLIASSLIDDPFDGANESRQQWIGDTPWRWSTVFDWHDQGEQRHDLVAHGLDTVATVMLNGQLVDRTENMHRAYRWDVRQLLREGENELEITFAAPVPESERRAAEHGALPRVNHHEYNQLRKMACSFGWDWGIDVAGAGIWKPIGLESWSDVRIGEVRPLVDVVPAGASWDGVLTAHVTVERAGGELGEEIPIVVRVSAPNGTVFEAAGAVAPGASATAVRVDVPDVERWWPVGHGAQPLYGVAVTAGDDVWSGRVGFRTVELDTEDDEHGAPFLLRVNGERILVRGVNWIPDHAFLTRIDADRYAQRVADARDANVNLMRVWGGGIYESDELYDLADEQGLLMWQDFPFACAAYSERPEMFAEVEAEARQNIARLTPHPSLVVWNGNNENTWGSVEWGWTGPLEGRGWGDAYYSGLFPDLLAELDGTRAYSPASPYSFGPYRHPNDERYGSMHIWDVWNREDYTVYATYRPRFLSEFGFQGPPAWSTLTRVVHDAPLDPFGEQMLVHQKANLGNAKLERGWQGHLPDPESIEDWHWTTQLNQAHAIRFGIEHMRSLTPLNTGVILWQLNDNWPVVSWSAVDFDGHRKPLWHAMRAAMAPRLATLQPRASARAVEAAWEGVEPECDELALVIVNDTAEPVHGRFAVRRERFDGTVLAQADIAVDVDARGAGTVAIPQEVALFGDAAQEYIVAEAEESIAGFAPAMRYAAEPVAQRLDARGLDVVASARDGGVDLHITARSLVRDVFCHADMVDPQARALEGMLTLRAGEHRVLRIDTDRTQEPDAFAEVVRSANDLLRG